MLTMLGGCGERPQATDGRNPDDEADADTDVDADSDSDHWANVGAWLWPWSCWHPAAWHDARWRFVVCGRFFILCIVDRLRGRSSPAVAVAGN